MYYFCNRKKLGSLLQYGHPYHYFYKKPTLKKILTI